MLNCLPLSLEGATFVTFDLRAVQRLERGIMDLFGRARSLQTENSTPRAVKMEPSNSGSSLQALMACGDDIMKVMCDETM
jgi:hypothetical protein